MAMLVTGYSIDSVKFDKNLKIWDKSGVSPCHLAEKCTVTWSPAMLKDLNRDRRDLNLFCVKIYRKN